MAHHAARRGEPHHLQALVRRDWLAGGSAAPLLRLLIDAGERLEAATLARCALADPACAERAVIERLLAEAGATPAEWVDAVIALARAPSEGHGSVSFDSRPMTSSYLRLRAAVQILMRLGVDPRLLFVFATNDGVVPDAIEMVQEGLIAPEIALERAERGSRSSYALWVGLAAEAALAQGRREDAVRLLVMAFQRAQGIPPTIHALNIRHAADPELHALLDAAGIPRSEALLRRWRETRDAGGADETRPSKRVGPKVRRSARRRRVDTDASERQRGKWRGVVDAIRTSTACA